jgi:uncharacterized membrane protein
MTDRNDHDPHEEPVLFSARLTPHRALTPRGFLALMLFFGAISFAAGVAFWMMGAWPVFGFFGLDVVLVWWAFRVNFRRARAYEDIEITATEVRVRRVSHRGHRVEWTMNPLWVRLDKAVHAEFGVEKLYLRARGRTVSVGSFLSPDEKASFGEALQAALNAARRGPDRNIGDPRLA